MIRWFLPLLVACGGDSDSAATPVDATWPTDPSADGIAAFLATGAHREAPWQAETATPRERNSDVSPHDRVQVWMNAVLIDSQAAGNGASGGTAHPTGAMVVKELYDTDDSYLGSAVMLKLDGDAAQWAYFCDGTPSRCGDSSTDSPIYGVALETDCGFCHGGLVFNTL